METKTSPLYRCIRGAVAFFYPRMEVVGTERRAVELHNGEAVERKYLNERICDGFTYAAIIKYFLRLLSHPDTLDEVPETVAQDIP